MAITKAISVRRVDGSYFKAQGLTFDRSGMISVYGDVWKDEADREINPFEPVLSRIAFFMNDEKIKSRINEKILAFIYNELAQEIPELAGGKAVIEAESVTLDQSEITLVAGKKKTLIATVLPEVAKVKDISWKSSDEKIATVTDGKVEAIAAGEATITCTSVVRGRQATCKVKVTEK